MMQFDYSELQHTRNIPGTEKSESVVDEHFLNILITNMQRNGKGNWEMPLPFKTDEVTLPSKLEQCMKRPLLGIRKKLLKNGETLKYNIILSSSGRSSTRISLIPPEEQRTDICMFPGIQKTSSL